MGKQARRKGALRRRRLRRNPAERPWDIIDEIAGSIGKIRTKAHSKPGEEGYYGEGYRAANYGAGREVFGPHGQSPDSAVDALRRAGVLGNDASVDDLWDAIERAAKARKAARRPDNPERQAEAFTTALRKQEKAKCKRLVPSGKLKVGQKFTMAGHPFKVQGIDPDTLEVDLIDGKKFGRQMIPDGATIPIDAKCKAKRPAVHKKAVSVHKPKRSVHKKAKPSHKRRVTIQTKRPAFKLEREVVGDLRYLIRRRRPRRKTPVSFVGVHVGKKVRILQVLGSSLRAVGTFGRQALERWAERNGIRIK